MAKAYLVLPQGYRYDDFYYFESDPHCGQPEAVFAVREDAEEFLKSQSVMVLKKWGAPIHLFFREANKKLEPKVLARVKELFGIDTSKDLAEFFTEYPDLSGLSKNELHELVELMNINVLCIVEADVDDDEYAKIAKGVKKRDPSRAFREKLSGAFDVPLDEYEPFPDD